MRKSLIGLSLPLLAALVSSCSSNREDPPLESRIIEVTSPVFQVMPGQEITKCIDVRLATTKPSNVVRLESNLLNESHHLILYRSAETAERTVPYDCSPFTGALNGTLPIYIAQTANTVVDLPQEPVRVALRIPAAQMVRLEMHYINYDTTKAMDAQGTVKLTTIDELEVDEYADLMFWGTSKIDIPNGMEGTVGPVWHAPPPGTTLLALTAHTHKYGIDFRIERAVKDMPGTEIYATQDWDNPPFTQFTPPLALGPTEGLRWSCKYRNTSGHRLTFGESANEEMCFLWGFYYPARGLLGFVDF